MARTWRNEEGMEFVSFTWQERLDAYYNIAAAGGSRCSESIGGEWFDWARREYGRYVEIDVESIPDDEFEEFEAYLAEEDDD